MEKNKYSRLNTELYKIDEDIRNEKDETLKIFLENKKRIIIDKMRNYFKK